MPKDFTIGAWVRRGRPAYTLWHLVQSDVGDAAFTKCGRRMERTLKSGTLEERLDRPQYYHMQCSACRGW